MTVRVKHFIKQILFGMLLLLTLLPAKNCLADTSESEASGRGRVVIRDEADLLTSSEENSLYEIMQESASFGNVLFLSVDENEYYSTYSLAEHVYEDTFGYSDGVIFVIDMDNRMLWISGFDSIQYIITDSYCDTITDNVYRDASDGDYYACSAEAFRQIHSLLVGKNIPQPMKYTCNFLLSLILALLINYFIIMLISRKQKASTSALRDNMIAHCAINNANAKFTRETKVYNPGSSSSGGSGGGGGGGSSGGGHSF